MNLTARNWPPNRCQCVFLSAGCVNRRLTCLIISDNLTMLRWLALPPSGPNNLIFVWPFVTPGATGWLGGLPWWREGWRDPLSSDAEQQLRESHGRRGQRRVGLQSQDVAPEVGAAWRPGQGHHQTPGTAGLPEVKHFSSLLNVPLRIHFTFSVDSS